MVWPLLVSGIWAWLKLRLGWLTGDAFLDAGPLHAQRLTANSYNAFIRTKKPMFCHFCSDVVMEDNPFICDICGAIVCKQVHVGRAGCIVHGSTNTIEETICPACHEKNGTVLPYWMDGFGIRRVAKMVWPLLVSSLRLTSLDDYLESSVLLALKHDYMAKPHNVSPV